MEKKKSGWNVKSVRKQSDAVTCHRCVEHSHILGKKQRSERSRSSQRKEGRKEEKGRKRWQERSLLPSSSPMFGVETPRNDKTGRPVWLSSRPPSPQNHSGSARLPV